jgi:hypothetical protein
LNIRRRCLLREAKAGVRKSPLDHATMPALIKELNALFEILDVCKEDLKTLLALDHPPADLLERIDRERSTMQDIKYLIADLKAQIAAKELHKYMMNEYTMIHQMNRLRV